MSKILCPLSKKINLLIINHPVNPLVDGMWSSWSTWTTCSKTCGSGTQARKRCCDNPKPAHNGTYCIGGGLQMQNCNASKSCPRKLNLVYYNTIYAIRNDSRQFLPKVLVYKQKYQLNTITEQAMDSRLGTDYSQHE